MTAEEKKHYNNGFILGMASKGVIQKTIIIDGGEGIDKVLSWDRHDSFALVLTPVMILDYTPIV